MKEKDRQFEQIRQSLASLGQEVAKLQAASIKAGRALGSARLRWLLRTSEADERAAHQAKPSEAEEER